MTTDWLETIKFNADGLVPAIAQDHKTGQIMMMAWQNKEALILTKQTGHAVYFSRSRNKLWHKGETSGHTQIVHDIYTDCDGDTVILSITQLGGIACHTGRASCFYQKLDQQNQWQITDEILKDPAQIYGNSHDAPTQTNLEKTHLTQGSSDVIAALDEILTQRKQADKDSSYVASLYHKGLNKILEKVGEEAVESILAAKELQAAQAKQPTQDSRKQADDLVYEVADTWFHQLVALNALGLSGQAVIAELARRFGVSGIDEKNSRVKQ